MELLFCLKYCRFSLVCEFDPHNDQKLVFSVCVFDPHNDQKLVFGVFRFDPHNDQILVFGCVCV